MKKEKIYNCYTDGDLTPLSFFINGIIIILFMSTLFFPLFEITFKVLNIFIYSKIGSISYLLPIIVLLYYIYRNNMTNLFSNLVLLTTWLCVIAQSFNTYFGYTKFSGGNLGIFIINIFNELGFYANIEGYNQFDTDCIIIFIIIIFIYFIWYFDILKILLMIRRKEKYNE